MKGYKVFNSDMTYMNTIFTTSGIHLLYGRNVLNNIGYSFYKDIEDIVPYFYNSSMRIFEIEANGIICEDNNGRNLSSTEIQLIKEISYLEIPIHINSSSNALKWAINIGDKHKMINKIDDINDIYKWLTKWPQDEQYFRGKGLI